MTAGRICFLAGAARRSYGCRACIQSITRPPTALLRAGSSLLQQPSLVSRQLHSHVSLKSKLYQFEDVKQLTVDHSQDRILIDVREPAEYEAGYIPTALNIPITSQPDALLLSAEEFEDRFGFPKPGLDKEVVFYCKAGVRSKAAARLAEQGGYGKVGEYAGSWLDWASRCGPSDKS